MFVAFSRKSVQHIKKTYIEIETSLSSPSDLTKTRNIKAVVRVLDCLVVCSALCGFASFLDISVLPHALARSSSSDTSPKWYTQRAEFFMRTTITFLDLWACSSCWKVTCSKKLQNLTGHHYTCLKGWDQVVFMSFIGHCKKLLVLQVDLSSQYGNYLTTWIPVEIILWLAGFCQLPLTHLRCAGRRQQKPA